MNYFVSPTGTDLNDGGELAPWETLSYAVGWNSPVNAGDIVYCRGGAFNERVIFGVSGKSNAKITLKGYPKEDAIIDGSGIGGGLWGSPLVLIDSEKNHINIEDLELCNFSGGDAIGIYPRDNKTCQGYKFNNLKIHDVGLSAIGAQGVYGYIKNLIIGNSEIFAVNQVNDQEAISIVGVDTFECAYNAIRDCLYREGIDAKVGCKNGIIHHNALNNIKSYAIYLDANYQAQSNIDVYNNVCSNSEAGLAFGSEGTHQSLTNINAWNNILYKNACGFKIQNVDNDNFALTFVFKNNTLYYNGSNHIKIELPGSVLSGIIRNNILVSEWMAKLIEFDDYASYPDKIAIDHNLYFVNSGYYDSEEIYGTNYVKGDPEFVDPENGDFHLSAGSPAIGAASNDGDIGIAYSTKKALNPLLIGSLLLGLMLFRKK